MPSTAMRSDGVTLSAGEEITAPLTATRPAAIHASASRREASPARAITLAMRSPGISLLVSLPIRLIRPSTSCLRTVYIGVDTRHKAYARAGGAGPSAGHDQQQA